MGARSKDLGWGAERVASNRRLDRLRQAELTNPPERVEATMGDHEARSSAPSDTATHDRADAMATRAGAASGEAVSRVYRDLVLPHLSANGGAPDWTRGLADSDLDAFCDLLAGADLAKALEFLDLTTERGVAFDGVLLGLLAGAARRLGHDWEYDRRPFAGVTVGMSRLQQALHHISARDPTRPLFVEDHGCALLAPCPGEQHTFGVLLLDTMMHRAGWRLRTLTDASGADLAHAVAGQWYDVIGLSASSPERLDDLERTIEAVRKSSKNREIKVIVGGHPFVANPDLGLRLNADAAPPDLPSAVRAAQRFVTRGRSTETEAM